MKKSVALVASLPLATIFNVIVGIGTVIYFSKEGFRKNSSYKIFNRENKDNTDANSVTHIEFQND